MILLYYMIDVRVCTSHVVIVGRLCTRRTVKWFAPPNLNTYQYLLQLRVTAIARNILPKFSEPKKKKIRNHRVLVSRVTTVTYRGRTCVYVLLLGLVSQ